MAKYKVYFSGFAYVEADSQEEAEDIYADEAIYEGVEVTDTEEVDEFVVEA